MAPASPADRNPTSIYLASPATKHATSLDASGSARGSSLRPHMRQNVLRLRRAWTGLDGRFSLFLRIRQVIQLNQSYRIGHVSIRIRGIHLSRLLEMKGSLLPIVLPSQQAAKVSSGSCIYGLMVNAARKAASAPARSAVWARLIPRLFSHQRNPAFARSPS